MKNFQIVLIFLLVISLGDSVNAQTANHKIQVGLHLKMESFVTNKHLNPGTGESIGMYLSVPTTSRSRLNIALAQRRLIGYEQQEAYLEQRTYPAQVHRIQHVKYLHGLRYLDVDLSWHNQFSKRKDFSWGIGLKFSKLAQIKGHRIKGILVSSPSSPARDFFEYEALEKEEFSKFNFGLVAQLDYRLIKNLRCNLSIHQGLNDLFGDFSFAHQQSHYLTQFSLGISADLL